ncbi:hypothetical protein T439DRAFT_356043 [Meredithblackwellia eburnea MCA 4105]
MSSNAFTNGTSKNPNPLLSKMNAGNSFHSPTDNVMSPCSQKLAQTKKRHYTKGKPLSLSASFQASVDKGKPSGSKLGSEVQSAGEVEMENVDPSH